MEKTLVEVDNKNTRLIEWYWFIIYKVNDFLQVMSRLFGGGVSKDLFRDHRNISVGVVLAVASVLVVWRVLEPSSFQGNVGIVVSSVVVGLLVSPLAANLGWLLLLSCNGCVGLWVRFSARVSSASVN